MNPDALISDLRFPADPQRARKEGRPYPSHLPGIKLLLGQRQSPLLPHSPLLLSSNFYQWLKQRPKIYLQLKWSRPQTLSSQPGSSVKGTQQRQNLYNTGCGSQKHYTDIMNWERGEYNQAKGIRTFCL